MNRSSPIRWLLLASLLGACGLVTLPEQRASDFVFTNSSVQVTPGQVAYLEDEQLSAGKIKPPKLPYKSVTIDAALIYEGTSPLLQIEVFASATRPACPLVASDLPGFGAGLLCEGPAGGQAVGEALLKPFESRPLHLEGRALDEAMRAGKLYLGIRLLSGQPGSNELIYVRNIRFNTKL